jgi:hypothetical protein
VCGQFGHAGAQKLLGPAPQPSTGFLRTSVFDPEPQGVVSLCPPNSAFCATSIPAYLLTLFDLSTLFHFPMLFESPVRTPGAFGGVVALPFMPHLV